jgi:hypothetical protein
MKSVFLYIWIMVILFVSSGCSFSEIGIASNTIDTKIPSDAKIEKIFDDHGGFTGDGEYFVVISLSDKQYQDFYERVKSTDKWNDLPISTEVHHSLYGFEKRKVFFS